MTTLTGAQAVAENEAQARNSTYVYRTPVPTLTIRGTAVNPSNNFADRLHKYEIMRDCYAGQLTIKAKGEQYLDRPANVDPKDYSSFKKRAYFYNATRRTHTGLLGAMMRKLPEITYPAGSNLKPKNVSIDGLSDVQFIRRLASELILTSRYGVLVDIPERTPAGVAPEPYFSGYTAEKIFATRRRKYRGRWIRDRVILIESEDTPNEYGVESRTIFRVLRLDPVSALEPEGRLRYHQEVVRPAVANGETTTVTPITVRTQGRELDYIPFVMFNPLNLLDEPQDPILLDLAVINLSHYESTALLEHGRFYAGMPTYWMSGEGAGAGASDGMGELADGLGGSNPLSVGPSNVWMLEKDDKVGLLEFTGHGLSFIENAVDDKQLQMHSLGGKLIPTQRKAAALSTEAYGLMEAGDEATLLDIAIQIDAGYELLMDYASDLQNIPGATGGRCETNKEFIRSELSAREITALRALREGGHIPEDVMYYALRQIGVIPMEYALADFSKLLDDPTQQYKPIPGAGSHDPDLQAKLKAAREASLAAARQNSGTQNTPPRQQEE